ncbi:hypothetical protein [Thiolapillus sp.]|uniref:hypothetical protein n=1 Tax=Thiolapillus sp. TaxID=2017437 RepID=UPI003AF997E0
MRTTGKQCGLAATGVYHPSLRSPWLAANDVNAPGEGGTHPSLSGQTHSPVVAEKNPHSAWR